MFATLSHPFTYSVYEDTVRQTPGRPEMLANYQALWLLPKAEMHQVISLLIQLLSRTANRCVATADAGSAICNLIVEGKDNNMHADSNVSRILEDGIMYRSPVRKMLLNFILTDHWHHEFCIPKPAPCQQ